MKYTKADLKEKLSVGTLNESETVEFKEQWGRPQGKEISAIGNSFFTGQRESVVT